jgi:uncharacterized cupin superfamily protein
MAVIIHDPARLAGRRTTVYPAAFAEGLKGRIKRALGDAGGLTQFGVNLTTLEAGAISALRHWHSREDEFVYILSGELTLVTDQGEELLGPGVAIAFPAGDPNAHQLANRGKAAATYLEIGTRAADDVITYPDDDLRLVKRDSQRLFVRKSGEPYE